jgi:energy-coupling factor transporter ATP-binding protein EcfA2
MTRGIAGLSLHNIGKFETFALELKDGEIVELQGDNDTGKTTVLEALWAAISGELSGKTSANSAAVDGKGTITAQIAGYQITRVTADKQTKSLEVLDSQGSRPYEGGAVQTFLNQVFPRGKFLNPFHLSRLPKKEQISTIVKALNIDVEYARDRLTAINGASVNSFNDAEGLFDAIRRLDKDYTEERLLSGRQVKVKEAGWRAAKNALPNDYNPDDPAPVQPPMMQEMYDQRTAIVINNGKRDAFTRRIAGNEQEIARLTEQIAKLTNETSVILADRHALGTPQDTADLDQRIADHQATMAEYQRAIESHGDLRKRHREADALYTEWKALDASYGVLDGKVKALAALPAELFARADLPIEGMFIEGDNIMLPDSNGELRPAEEFGDAALLDMYIALAMTLAPIPTILADGLEQCGPKRSAEIYDHIREKGFQLIGTRVTEGELKLVTINPATSPDGQDIPD